MLVTKLITGPTSEPITREVFMEHMRIVPENIQYFTITLATFLATGMITINGLVFTAHATTTTKSARQFSIAGTDTQDAAELVSCINDSTYGVPGVMASNAAGVVTLKATVPVTISSAPDDATCVKMTILDKYIKVARIWCEKMQGRAYMPQTWELYSNDWPVGKYIQLPKSPLQSVTSLKYYDDADVEYVFDSTNYNIDEVSEPGRIVLKYGYSWPGVRVRTSKGIIVRYVSGYEDETKIPPTISQAILMLAGHLYEARTFSVEELIQRENLFGVMDLLEMDKVDWF